MILLVLIALAARVDAAPCDRAPSDDAIVSDDAISLAIRYADILTGAEREGAGGPARSSDDEEDCGDARDGGEVRDGEPEEIIDLDHQGALFDDDAVTESPASSDEDLDGVLDADPADPVTITSDDASLGAGSAGAAETYEVWMRHRRPSAWGRLDVGLAWRRRWSEPMHAQPHRVDEAWLVATWRR